MIWGGDGSPLKEETADTSTYTPTATDVGKYLIVVATTTDATGSRYVSTTLVVAPIEITGFIAIPAKDAGLVGAALFANAAAVIAALPEIVTANVGAGTVLVPVTTWADTESYNPAAAGSYTFTAVLGTLPTGYGNTGHFTATVEVVLAPAAHYNMFEASVNFGATTHIITTVDNSFNSTLTLQSGASIDPSTVTVNSSVRDIPELGISGTKSDSLEISTGIAAIVPLSLADVLTDIYSFTGATIYMSIAHTPADIQATYTVHGFTAGHITSAPDDLLKAQAMWAETLSHIHATAVAGNSKIVIPAGTFLQIGTERLTFGSQLVLDGITGISQITTAILNATTLSTETENGSMQFYLPAGTILCIDTAQMELRNAAMIKVYGPVLPIDPVTHTVTILSHLKTSAGSGTLSVILTMINTLNEIVAASNGKSLEVGIAFVP